MVRRISIVIIAILIGVPWVVQAEEWQVGYTTVNLPRVHANPADDWPTVTFWPEEFQASCKKCKSFMTYEIHDTHYGDSLVIQYGKFGVNRHAQPYLMVRAKFGAQWDGVVPEACLEMGEGVQGKWKKPAIPCNTRVFRPSLGTPITVRVYPTPRTDNGVVTPESRQFIIEISTAGWDAPWIMDGSFQSHEGRPGLLCDGQPCPVRHTLRENTVLSVYARITTPVAGGMEPPPFTGHAEVQTDVPEQWIPLLNNPGDAYTLVGPVSGFTVSDGSSAPLN